MPADAVVETSGSLVFTPEVKPVINGFFGLQVMIEPGVHQGGAQLKPRMGETHVSTHDLFVDRSFCQQVVDRAVKSVADNGLKITVGGITIEHFI